MTIKKRELYLSFLTEKLGKIVARGDPGVKAALAGPHAAVLLYLGAKERLTLSDIKQADAEIELMSRGVIGRQAFDEAMGELTRQFGFGRVAEDPNRVVQRIIKRGKIAGKDDLRVVQGVLSHVGDDFHNAAERTALEAIFRKYEGW